MVFGVCLGVYALLAGAWLLEHGWLQAMEIGTALAVAICIVLGHTFFIWVAAKLFWPQKSPQTKRLRAFAADTNQD